MLRRQCEIQSGKENVSELPNMSEFADVSSESLWTLSSRSAEELSLEPSASSRIFGRSLTVYFRRYNIDSFQTRELSTNTYVIQW